MGRRLREALSFLPETICQEVYNSYDIVGDIAILRLTTKSRDYEKSIAEAVMNIHRNVKTVLAQIDAIKGDFRLRKLRHVAGEEKTKTIHTENRCRFILDLAQCYFSPRLMFERDKIANQVQDGETVVNMFAGVGCFSIMIAKHSNCQRVYSIELNPAAVRFMEENIRINGVYGRVVPILGDARQTIEKRLIEVADRVLMPLPEKAFKYLPCALLCLRRGGGIINYHEFAFGSSAEESVQGVRHKVSRSLSELGVVQESEGRAIRSVGPRWFQVVLDINVKSVPDKLNKQ